MCDRCELGLDVDDNEEYPIDYSQYEVEVIVREKKTGNIVGSDTASYDPNPDCLDLQSEMYGFLLEIFDSIRADKQYEANQKEKEK